MRILFLNGRFPQVSQTFVLNQIDHALSGGHDADLFCAVLVRGISHEIITRHDLYARFIYGLPPDGRNLARLARAALRRPGRALQSLAGLATRRTGPVAVLAAMQLEHEPDVIVANFGPNGIVGAALKTHFFPRARLVTIFHGHDVSSYTREHGWDRYRAIAPQLDLALCVTEVWARELREHAGIPAEVHYLGIPLGAIPPRTARSGGPFQILCVGRLVEKKGVAYLLEATAALLAAGHRVRLRVLGDGPLLAELQAKAAALGIAAAVSFEGSARHEQVLAAMAEADCLVAPSVTAADGDSEGIPVTIMEAMASGLPVVSTWHAGIPELVGDGVSGLLAPERDVAALVRHIETLMGSPEHAARLAAAARRVIETRFDAATQNATLFARMEGLVARR